ncbi:hypothetical protein [Streptomyces cylindrosporus]|uniref:Uncharacterized protein n=1 Tax=Streptomyces cylindrosporus TaxID=2927583 RepID=A0ABS9YH47_9ACTN|nr:hypothetical protein [Streptomyces cylindrosporus]MCI3276269.1 hypothetical protein [Streptomyces cylindrosporus]
MEELIRNIQQALSSGIHALVNVPWLAVVVIGATLLTTMARQLFLRYLSREKRFEVVLRRLALGGQLEEVNPPGPKDPEDMWDVTDDEDDEWWVVGNPDSDSNSERNHDK